MSGLTVIKEDGTVVEVPLAVECAGGAALCNWVDARAAALRMVAVGDGAPAVELAAPAAGDEEEEG